LEENSDLLKVTWRSALEVHKDLLVFLKSDLFLVVKSFVYKEAEFWLRDQKSLLIEEKIQSRNVDGFVLRVAFEYLKHLHYVINNILVFCCCHFIKE
jgi:hypothetical protein